MYVAHFVFFIYQYYTVGVLVLLVWFLRIVCQDHLDTSFLDGFGRQLCLSFILLYNIVSACASLITAQKRAKEKRVWETCPVSFEQSPEAGIYSAYFTMLHVYFSNRSLPCGLLISIFFYSDFAAEEYTSFDSNEAPKNAASV